MHSTKDIRVSEALRNTLVHSTKDIRVSEALRNTKTGQRIPKTPTSSPTNNNTLDYMNKHSEDIKKNTQYTFPDEKLILLTSGDPANLQKRTYDVKSDNNDLVLSETRLSPMAIV